MSTFSDRLLGRPGPDPGCEEAFGIMDAAAEAHVAGEDIGRRFPGFALHVHNCPACREDFDGLCASVAQAPPTP